MSDRNVSALAALDEPVRASLYRFVRDAHKAVTREEAAAGVGISGKLAAFHLEKLLELGLLEAKSAQRDDEHPRPGRMPKAYSIAHREFAHSVPARRYDLLGEVLLEALDSSDDDGRSRQNAIDVASQRGRRVGESIREQKRLGRVGPERALAAAEEHLASMGFEPGRSDPRTIELHNCPFRTLAQRWPDLVCEMNRSYLEALVLGIGSDQVKAVLAPRPGMCCVELRAG